MRSSPSPAALGISEWAQRTPDRVAITDAQGELTFAEVEQAIAVGAARIATERPITSTPIPWLPLLVDRSRDSALAILAAIRAGQPFVPIDYATPPDRLRSVLERLGSPSHVACGRADLLNEGAAHLRNIVLDAMTGDRLDPQPVDPTAPALAIFTSGSTGRPKVVVRQWNAFANRLLVQNYDGLCAPGERWNLATIQPFTFSPGHRGLAAMTFGRTMHITDPSTQSADALLRWFNEHEINEVTLSATLLRSILDHATVEPRVPTLRLVRMGAEASTWDLVEPVRRLAAPDVLMTAGYGASEIGRTFWYEIRPDTPIQEGRIPIGYPIDPAQVRLEPVDGDPTITQLVVRTDESLGYLDDPELQAARYERDADGHLWWRSGDIAVVDEAGVYHHRGRIDDMVKINGLLVEPAESERVLRSMPGIVAAAVLPKKRANGKWRLDAHIVVGDPMLTPEAVMAKMRATLARHLVPSVLVRHQSLPFNERNKLDRDLLRTAPLQRWRSAEPAPIHDETTRWIAARVAAIVELDDVGADDDIWDLGVDSLAAVELCAAFADAGLGELDPPQLLIASTPALIAARLRSNRGQSSPVVTLNAGGARPALFVVPGGGGTALAFRSLARELGADQPLIVVEPRGLHQHRVPDHSIRAMASRVVAEVRGHVPPGAAVPLLGYSSGATIAFEAAHQLIGAGYVVRLFFLDATVRARNTARDSIRVRHAIAAPDTSWTARRNDRSVGSLVAQSPAIAGRLVRRVARRSAHALDTRLTYRPWSKQRFDERHYERFGALISRASARYAARPLPTAITVIESEAVGRGERTRPWATSVTVLSCGGDHFTVLEPPHVVDLADLLRPALDGCSPNG